MAARRPRHYELTKEAGRYIIAGRVYQATAQGGIDTCLCWGYGCLGGVHPWEPWMH